MVQITKKKIYISISFSLTLKKFQLWLIINFHTSVNQGCATDPVNIAVFRLWIVLYTSVMVLLSYCYKRNFIKKSQQFVALHFVYNLFCYVWRIIEWKKKSKVENALSYLFCFHTFVNQMWIYLNGILKDHWHRRKY